LKGEYDILLSWNALLTNGGTPRGDSTDLEPTLPQALEEQLGLQLQSKKTNVEVLVVDSAAKVPSEN
jgi:uncharacterized protein (TIGR03435 family)